ncbi:hypothetical protein E2562_033169, partial [Oryza meyeriana var. granulata]
NAGLVTLIEPINITEWEKQYYIDIPQQIDSLLLSKCNKVRRPSYKHPITQAEFLSKFERDTKGEE